MGHFLAIFPLYLHSHSFSSLHRLNKNCYLLAERERFFPVQVLVLLAKKKLNGVIWNLLTVIQIWLRDRIMLMYFIFLLNLQRALLSQTFQCFVGIF